MGAPASRSGSQASPGAAKASPPIGFDPSRKLRVLSLFAGIGGFDLGLERTGGFETVAFCEIDTFCQQILAKHWPGVPCYDDVQTLTGERLAADGIAVDAICGGFPCQDISNAGKRAGLDGERSGLWGEYRRLIGELRPAFVIVENSAALLGNGMGRVLGDLAALGYDAVSHAIPASAIGAPHARDRCWVIAHSRQVRRGGAGDTAQCLKHGRGRAAWRQPVAPAWRNAYPELQRVADGVPSRLDRNRVAALGNAVVPQIPELIGRAILASLAEQRRAA